MVGIFLRFRICPTASLQKKEFPFKILMRLQGMPFPAEKVNRKNTFLTREANREKNPE